MRKFFKKSNKSKVESNKVIVDGIEFKSDLEGDVYKYLRDNFITPVYERQSYTLWTGGPTKTQFYNAKKGHLRHFKSDLDDITYTPDFDFVYENKSVFIETKGWENDSFPIRKKMFRKYLDNNIPNAYYFEIRSIMQLKDAIEILKYGKIISKTKSNKK